MEWCSAIENVGLGQVERQGSDSAAERERLNDGVVVRRREAV